MSAQYVNEILEEDKANMKQRLVVVQNFCYTCPFCEPVEPARKSPKSGNPVMKCGHPVFVHEERTPPVLREGSAFIPPDCPLQDGPWTVELHPRDRKTGYGG
jgi:hypothetical protein